MLLTHLVMAVYLQIYNFKYGGTDISYDALWKTYQVKYGKKYSTEELGMRRLIFEQNAYLIGKHNLEADFGFHTHRLEINKFSDKTEEEKNAYRKCFKPGNVPNATKVYDSECGKTCIDTLPSYVDWRKKGYVTNVKDQGDCGSCWAFSSTGALEGQTKAKTGKLISLSEQNLVDCSSKQGNDGCDGGWMEYAFQYVIDNRGIDTENFYKYEATDGTCRFKKYGVGANCTKYHMIKPGSEAELQSAVAKIGPISVAISVTGQFLHYKDGVFYDHKCSTHYLDHAVLVVGYGSQNGSDYWIVKNSWGSDWGLNGYILMARNKHNHCGIASHAVYPIV